MANDQLAKRLVRELASSIGVYRSGNPNGFLRTERRNIEASGAKRRKQQFARLLNNRLPFFGPIVFNVIGPYPLNLHPTETLDFPGSQTSDFEPLHFGEEH